MKFISYLKKLKVENSSPINYYINTENDFININKLIGKHISLKYLNKKKCFCGEIKDKTFRQNFCYDCFYKLPQAGDSIFFPEKSKAHLGVKDRDLKWEKEFQLQPHIVYLAVSGGGIKIGVTRESNKFIRWIDQGADYATIISTMPNRYLAGILESEMKSFISDKTNWQKMLKNITTKNYNELINENKDIILKNASKELNQYLSKDTIIYELKYPHIESLEKIKSVNFDKENEITGTLTGVKGQYLIFDKINVFNVRRHEGFKTEISF